MRVRFATSALSRLKGLLFATPTGEEESTFLVLAPCSSIHTFGMRHPIDVAFVDTDGVVLASYELVRSGRLLSCRGAALTLERFSQIGGRNPAPWFAKGDVLHFDN